jgi:hypothetical protein
MKKLILRSITIGTILCYTLVLGISQGSKAKKPLADVQDLPTVFILGEYNEPYEALMSGQSTLLDVCDNDMNFAYHKLTGMMKDMEAYASTANFDLKGINAWMHFFWRADGSIDHIGFYLKPNSRNVPNEQVKSFLEGFAKQYKLPLRYNKKFSHYSSFSFPIIRHDSGSDSVKSTSKVNTSKRGS